MEEFTITEISEKAGLRASAIRYYESVNLLPTPQRINGRRRYTADVLRRLSFIQVAQAAGFSLAEMQTLLNELEGSTPLSERWQVLAQQKLVEVDNLIRKATGMKRLLKNGLDCSCANLDECIDCVLKIRCK
jgi:MerR family redox-sensitive transcriptional activator SoxR